MVSTKFTTRLQLEQFLDFCQQRGLTVEELNISTEEAYSCLKPRERLTGNLMYNMLHVTLNVNTPIAKLQKSLNTYTELVITDKFMITYMLARITKGHGNLYADVDEVSEIIKHNLHLILPDLNCKHTFNLKHLKLTLYLENSNFIRGLEDATT